MNALQIVGRRTYFAVSVNRGGNGPFLAAAPVGKHPLRVRYIRQAELFDLAAADAILRANPKYAVLQAVQIGEPRAAAND